jgi:hypothetical protein
MSGDLQVAVSALHADAQKWSTAAQNVTGAQQAANSDHLTAAQFSYFGDQQGLTHTYAALQAKMVDLLGQASTNFTKISSTLLQVAANYEHNEKQISNHFRSIH